MKLEFKPDFEVARGNWIAYWKNENKRPPIWVVTPKQGVAPVDLPAYLAGHDGNFDPIVDQVLSWAESHEFVGDAIPNYYAEFGPDSFASFLGADLRFLPRQQTSWSVPFVDEWDDIEIKFQRDGYWWQMTEAFIKALRARCDGKLLITPPALAANLDALAAIRGAEKLLLDLVEVPEKINYALSRVCDAHSEIMQAYAELTDFDAYGTVNCEKYYSPGRQSRPQCDISCMISGDMFREFVIPSLEREAADMENVVYHLDGPEAVRHLDALLEMDWLDAVDFIPGENGIGRDWSKTYKKIIAKGKGYKQMVFDHMNLKRICENPPSRKIFFVTAASTKTEAEELIADIIKIWPY